MNPLLQAGKALPRSKAVSPLIDVSMTRFHRRESMFLPLTHQTPTQHIRPHLQPKRMPRAFVRRRSDFKIDYNHRVVSCTQRRPGILFVSIRTPESCTCDSPLLLVDSSLAPFGLALPLVGSGLALAGLVLPPAAVALGLGLAGLALAAVGFAHDHAGLALGLAGSGLGLAGLVLPAAAVALGSAGLVLVVADFARFLVGLGLDLAGLELPLAGLAHAVAYFVHTAAGLAPAPAGLAPAPAGLARALAGLAPALAGLWCALADVVLLLAGLSLVLLRLCDLSKVAILTQHQQICRQAILVGRSLRRQVRPNRTLHDQCVPRLPHEEDGSLLRPSLPLIMLVRLLSCMRDRFRGD